MVLAFGEWVVWDYDISTIAALECQCRFFLTFLHCHRWGEQAVSSGNTVKKLLKDRYRRAAFLYFVLLVLDDNT